MKKTKKYFDEMYKAIEAAGGKKKLALSLEIEPGAVSNWLRKTDRVFPSYYNAIRMNKLYGIEVNAIQRQKRVDLY